MERISKNNSIYKIEFRTPEYALINSLLKTRIIQGGSTDETYKRVYFKAESVKSLSEYLCDNKVKYGKNILLVSEAAQMIYNLSTQLDYLIRNELHTIIGYNIEDMIVINDEKFAFLGSELVAKIDDNTNLAMISCPFSVSDFFFSPEILKIRDLPSYVHYKSSYFSLALLMINVLVGNDDFYKEYINDKKSDKIIEALNNHSIKNSKLFWLLSRCLVEEAKDRCIIMI